MKVKNNKTVNVLINAETSKGGIQIDGFKFKNAKDAGQFGQDHGLPTMDNKDSIYENHIHLGSKTWKLHGYHSENDARVTTYTSIGIGQKKAQEWCEGNEYLIDNDIQYCHMTPDGLQKLVDFCRDHGIHIK